MAGDFGEAGKVVEQLVIPITKIICDPFYIALQ